MTRICKFICVAIALICTGANAETLCGRLTSDGWIEVDGISYRCLRGGSGENRDSELERVYWAEVFSAVCVEYFDMEKRSNNLYELSFCEIDTYACRGDQYYTPGGCEMCNNGNRGDVSDGHTNPTCGYCYNEHYYYSDADDDCYPCPGGGYANDIESPISECYITPNQIGTDKTGTYENMDTRCYWVE